MNAVVSRFHLALATRPILEGIEACIAVRKAAVEDKRDCRAKMCIQVVRMLVIFSAGDSTSI